MSATTSGTAATKGRFTVRNIRTGETIGNHTFNEADTRARVMERNWCYREKFDVIPLTAEMIEFDRAHCAVLPKAGGDR